MLKPTLEEIKQLAQDGRYQTAPVSLEILSDIRTPIEVLRKDSVSMPCKSRKELKGEMQAPVSRIIVVRIFITNAAAPTASANTIP